MIKTFEDAYSKLDQAINDIEIPELKPLVQAEVQLATQHPRELVALGVSHVEDVAHKVNREVRDNPLLFIGGVAVASLAIGFLVSRARSENA